jgi:hypothetical protein
MARASKQIKRLSSTGALDGWRSGACGAKSGLDRLGFSSTAASSSDLAAPFESCGAVESLRTSMSTLDQTEVFEACRALYKMAGEDFMLPPLVRHIEIITESSSQVYYIQTRTNLVKFVVEFDQTYVNKSKFPLKKFPLLFRSIICGQASGTSEVELGDAERAALIRAFLLGAKAPIVVEKSALAARYKILLQLSSTFFLDCGELIDEGSDLTSDVICGRVGMSLYDKSKDFFQSPQEGLAVWSARAAQELFGMPKPSAETFWPVVSQKGEEAPS